MNAVTAYSSPAKINGVGKSSVAAMYGVYYDIRSMVHLGFALVCEG